LHPDSKAKLHDCEEFVEAVRGLGPKLPQLVVADAVKNVLEALDEESEGVCEPLDVGAHVPRYYDAVLLETSSCAEGLEPRHVLLEVHVKVAHAPKPVRPGQLDEA